MPNVVYAPLWGFNTNEPPISLTSGQGFALEVKEAEVSEGVEFLNKLNIYGASLTLHNEGPVGSFVDFDILPSESELRVRVNVMDLGVPVIVHPVGLHVGGDVEFEPLPMPIRTLKTPLKVLIQRKESLFMKQGDTIPTLVAQIVESDNKPFVIDEQSYVSVSMREHETREVVFSGQPAEIIDAANGIVAYHWVPSDTQTPGRYILDIEITTPYGQRITAPTHKYVNVEILAATR